MRNLTFFLFVFFFSMVNAQDLSLKSPIDSTAIKQNQDSIFTILNVTKMALFPGCKTPAEDKLASITCFSEKLNQELMKHFDTTYPDTPIPKMGVKTKLAFVTSVEGYITQIEAVEGDPEFYAQSTQALEAVAVDLINREQFFVPAELKDGTPVSLIYHTNIVLPNPDYRKDVITYLYEQDCTVDEIMERLPSYEIYNLNKSHIQMWIERYESLNKTNNATPTDYL